MTPNPNIRDAIGIDIGTSKCRIAICRDKDIQIIEHESNKAIPSYVAYSKQGEWLVGKMAGNYAACLQNVIYDIRWLLGKTNSEISRAQDKKRYFFKRSEYLSDNGRATFDMIVPSKDPKIVDAKEMFEKLLYALFSTAYKNLRHPTTIAITIPIKSTQNYKNLVEDCVRSVVNNIVNSMSSPTIKLIDEPIAVAAAYAPRLNLDPKSNVALVFCMGAGYLQVNAYFIEKQSTDLIIREIDGIKPIVQNGFVGDYFDQLIYDNMIERLKAQNNGSFLNLSMWAQRRLKIECEKVKCALSSAPSTRIDVDSLYMKGNEDCDLVDVVQKEDIERYYKKEIHYLIQETRNICRNITPKFILLGGGSTRIPLIINYLKEAFKESIICNFLNMNEVAAIGAAAIASKTVTVANKSIDYNHDIKIIQEQKKEEEQRKQPPITTPSAKPAGDSKLSEKGIGISLIDNTMTELSRNVNNSQIGRDNSFNNSHQILCYCLYSNNGKDETRICLFNSYTCSVEGVAKFNNYYKPYEVATTQSKIFGIREDKKSFEIYDLNIRQLSRGPDPPEWRRSASVAYFKDKLYYLGGTNPKTRKNTNRVDVLIDGKWQTGPAFPLPIHSVQTITCDGILYVIDGWDSRKIYRLSDNERGWVEIGEIPEERLYFGIASLNGKLYITGGFNGRELKSCECFDPSAPVDSRISRIADMNYARYDNSLIVANGKLYAIGGVQKGSIDFYNSIEEYDPQAKKWREVGKLP